MTKAVAKLYRKAQSKNKEILNKCKSFSVSTNWIKFEQYPHRVIPTTKQSSKHESFDLFNCLKKVYKRMSPKLVHNFLKKKAKSFNIDKRYEKSKKL
jgi:hypothetical protein